MIDDSSVKLKVSGQPVDPYALPENLVASIAHVFSTMKNDPFAILATYAYIFCGLTVHDITQMIILSDRSGTRTASREYIRQKVVTTFHKIKAHYREEYGDGTVSPLFRDRNMDPSEVSGIGNTYKHIVKEINDNNEDTTEEELIQKAPQDTPFEKNTAARRQSSAPQYPGWDNTLY